MPLKTREIRRDTRPAPQRTLHVAPAGRRTWRVTGEDFPLTPSLYRTPSEALRDARDYLIGYGGGMIAVYDDDGMLLGAATVADQRMRHVSSRRPVDSLR